MEYIFTSTDWSTEEECKNVFSLILLGMYRSNIAVESCAGTFFSFSSVSPDYLFFVFLYVNWGFFCLWRDSLVSIFLFYFCFLLYTAKFLCWWGPTKAIEELDALNLEMSSCTWSAADSTCTTSKCARWCVHVHTYTHRHICIQECLQQYIERNISTYLHVPNNFQGDCATNMIHYVLTAVLLDQMDNWNWMKKFGIILHMMYTGFTVI